MAVTPVDGHGQTGGLDLEVHGGETLYRGEAATVVAVFPPEPVST